MGLSIVSQSEYEYHYSYGALHRVRYMGYLASGGREEYSTWHELYAKNDPEVRKSLELFPNLIWHSDCDGSYSLRGKHDDLDNPKNGLSTGNSKQLLKELETIHEYMYNDEEARLIVDGYTWDIFDALHKLVEDAVNNYNGRIEFN